MKDSWSSSSLWAKKKHYPHQHLCSNNDQSWRNQGEVLWNSGSHHLHCSIVRHAHHPWWLQMPALAKTTRPVKESFGSKEKEKKYSCSGLLLLRTCVTQDVAITNTTFLLLTQNKVVMLNTMPSGTVIVACPSSLGVIATCFTPHFCRPSLK